MVSIRAPARGATILGGGGGSGGLFRSALPRGERLEKDMCLAA